MIGSYILFGVNDRVMVVSNQTHRGSTTPVSILVGKDGTPLPPHTHDPFLGVLFFVHTHDHFIGASFFVLDDLLGHIR